jgi:ribonuclease III
MTRLARPPLSALEQSLGHAFRDRALLEQALTHISVTAAGRRIDSYQRLEFLGDRVLGLAVADMLYQAFPDDEEGALSRRLSELVRQETCAAVAVDWGVGPHLRLGQGEVASGARKRMTILGDACEALIGAAFVDAGFDIARSVVYKAWQPRLLASEQPFSDAKTVLQEWAQARALRAPTYRLVSRSGPDHSPRFVVAVDVEAHLAAEGNGPSKRLAEQAAASAFMAREGVGKEAPDHG